jgi:hypothetical protein
VASVKQVKNKPATVIWIHLNVDFVFFTKNQCLKPDEGTCVYYIGDEMNTTQKRTIPWYLWPFWAIWRLVVIIIGLTGRLVGAILGLALLIVGIVLSLTVVGAFAGIPLGLLGILLMVRSIF